MRMRFDTMHFAFFSFLYTRFEDGTTDARQDRGYIWFCDSGETGGRTILKFRILVWRGWHI